ncbi:MAG: hypothetical protein HKN25_01595 [Pyrinomonadaceae bacterium]|nr:hypothetical protein [Pyrinomonadaceae bacterium]
MKRYLNIFMVVAALSTFSLGQDRKVNAVRTELSDKTCKATKSAPDPKNGVIGSKRCKGAAGFTLEIDFYEHGQDLTLISPGGKKFSIKMFTPMNEESYIGKEIEWRGLGSGKHFEPSAIIFEHDIIRRIAPDEEAKSKLAVVKIGEKSACLIADALTGRNYNLTKARKFADESDEMSCFWEELVNPANPYNEEFQSVNNFLAANLSKLGSGVSASAKGDLNGDGLEDWAGVVWDTQPEVLGGDVLSTLYVLLTDKKKGVLRVAGMSEEGMIRNSNCCSVEDVRIKNRSVYLQINARSHGGVRATTYQFKQHKNNAWRLIGLRIYNAISGDESREDSAIETDMNLLTGDVIVSWHEGKGNPEMKRRREKFEEFYLSRFDFGNVPAERFQEPPDSVQ